MMITAMEHSAYMYLYAKRTGKRDLMQEIAKKVAWMMTDEVRDVYILKCVDGMDEELGNGRIYFDHDRAYTGLSDYRDEIELDPEFHDDYYIEASTMTGREYAALTFLD